MDWDFRHDRKCCGHGDQRKRRHHRFCEDNRDWDGFSDSDGHRDCDDHRKKDHHRCCDEKKRRSVSVQCFGGDCFEVQRHGKKDFGCKDW